jgi:hypothetical protein
VTYIHVAVGSIPTSPTTNRENIMMVVLTGCELDNPFFVSFRTLGEAKAAYPRFRFEGDKWYYTETSRKKKPQVTEYQTGKDRRNHSFYGGVIGCYDTENREHLHHMAVAIMLATRQH